MRRPGPYDDDPRTPRLKRIEAGVEQRLRELSESGELSGLPGEGAPLPLDDPEGERWAAFHVMKNARVLPEWAELRRDIDASRADLARRVAVHHRWRRARAAQLRTLPAERIVDAARATEREIGRFEVAIGTAVAEHNAKIHRYNARVPVAALQLVPLRIEAVLAVDAADARRP